VTSPLHKPIEQLLILSVEVIQQGDQAAPIEQLPILLVAGQPQGDQAAPIEQLLILSVAGQPQGDQAAPIEQLLILSVEVGPPAGNRVIYAETSLKRYRLHIQEWGKYANFNRSHRSDSK